MLSLLPRMITPEIGNKLMRTKCWPFGRKWSDWNDLVNSPACAFLSMTSRQEFGLKQLFLSALIFWEFCTYDGYEYDQKGKLSLLKSYGLKYWKGITATHQAPFDWTRINYYFLGYVVKSEMGEISSNPFKKRCLLHHHSQLALHEYL